MFCFVSSARLGKVDVDSNSFTSQELKKALAKMKESEKAERKVRRVPCFSSNARYTDANALHCMSRKYDG